MKTIRKRSPMPFFVVGVVFLLYGLWLPLSMPIHYIIAGVVGLFVYKKAHKKYPDIVEQKKMPPNTGDEACNQLLTESNSALDRIRAANDAIPDVELSACIFKLEATCSTIFKRLEEKPSLQSQLRSFLRYYLPTTLLLLETRAKLETEEDKNNRTAQKVRDDLGNALKMVQQAFDKQLDALDKDRFINIQTEIDVLESLLRADGLTISPKAVEEKSL